VLRDGPEVGVADKRLIRPEVGTAGPSRQLVIQWWYVQCHAVVSCILRSLSVDERVEVICQ
jgi:hypothetical protein